VTLPALLAYLQAEDEYGAGLDIATPTEADSVKLLTVHRAKGLEWDAVFLVGVAEDKFPTSRTRTKWTAGPGVLPYPLRGDARDLRLRREQLADERHWTGLRHGDDQHLARLRLGYGRVDHQVVVLAAAHGSRRAGCTRFRHDLDQRHVDHLGAPRRLVHRRGAQPGELGATIRHSALTTCGVTRWNASAYRIPAFPEERRAWLPRCSERCE